MGPASISSTIRWTVQRVKGCLAGDAVFVGLSSRAMAVCKVRGMNVIDAEAGLMKDFEVEYLTAPANDDHIGLPFGQLTVKPCGFHFAGVNGDARGQGGFDGGGFGFDSFRLRIVFPDALLETDFGFGIDGVVGGHGDHGDEAGM